MNLYEVIMTSLQGVMKWSHGGFRYFPNKILILILLKEIMFDTGTFPLVAP